eukprot:gene6642-7953_t
MAGCGTLFVFILVVMFISSHLQSVCVKWPSKVVPKEEAQTAPKVKFDEFTGLSRLENPPSPEAKPKEAKEDPFAHTSHLATLQAVSRNKIKPAPETSSQKVNLPAAIPKEDEDDAPVEKAKSKDSADIVVQSATPSPPDSDETRVRI